jgi:hypothetical protein
MAAAKNGSKKQNKKMTPQEAGRMGGLAHHDKRGAHGSDKK